jgi:hypothetical protein
MVTTALLLHTGAYLTSRETPELPAACPAAPLWIDVCESRASAHPGDWRYRDFDYE